MQIDSINMNRVQDIRTMEISHPLIRQKKPHCMIWELCQIETSDEVSFLREDYRFLEKQRSFEISSPSCFLCISDSGSQFVSIQRTR